MTCILPWYDLMVDGPSVFFKNQSSNYLTLDDDDDDDDDVVDDDDDDDDEIFVKRESL